MSNLLKNLWQNRLRCDLHNPSNWKESSSVKLVHVPTGSGFYGDEQMKTFFSYPGNACKIFTSDDIQSVNFSCDDESGSIFDEFVLNWTQKTSRMEWMLPGNDIPLQKYQISFVISAKIDLSSGLLQNVRVYWDQMTFLLQSGLLMRSLRSLIRPGNSEALENALAGLPVSENYDGLLQDKSAHFLRNASNTEERASTILGGGLNRISSILEDLPRSNFGPAVQTPQRPTSSRSLNPALLGTLKLGFEEAVASFDSPVGKVNNSRNVKSRNNNNPNNNNNNSSNNSNIFGVEAENEEEKPQKPQITQGLFDRMHSPDTYKPSLGLNSGSLQNAQSRIFSSPTKQKRPQNLEQTDKILFESHIFDSLNDGDNSKQRPQVFNVATAPPQCPSTIISPEEDMSSLSKQPLCSASLSRPGMQGHFRGAQIGEPIGQESEKAPISTSAVKPARFDPNRSQIVLGDSF